IVPFSSGNEEKHGFELTLNKATDSDGNEINESNPLDPGEQFRLYVDWALANDHNYVEGDTKEIDLPEGLDFSQTFAGELRDGNGDLVAEYEVTPDNQMTLTFTNYVENHSDVSGNMWIATKLDEDKVEEDDGKASLDGINDEGQLEIPINQDDKTKTVEKQGVPKQNGSDDENAFGSDKIDWTVTINKENMSLDDAKI